MYKGFYCDNLPGLPKTNATLTVASIDFNGYGLCAPSLTGFVDAFPDLALFHANSNNFTGNVPDLSALPYFYELDLSNNNFSGGFPDTVVPLGGLAFLDLRFNRFAGTVPPPVFGLSVEALFLNNNGFSGSIPESLGSTRAQYLVVANNQFTGPIPRSIYNTSGSLSEVLFLNNKLSGCLPYEIGLVEGLAVFDAGGNEITGPIPLSFGCLGSVEELNLAGNQLYGHVPDVLCLLAKTGKLQNLSLSDNYFHSVGHHCMELVRSRVLDVRRNCILGFPDQRPALECAWFYADPPEHCPFVPHIPCDLPGFKPPATAAAALPATAHGHAQGGGN
uniref:Leucine-rich repeat-containing N-terminal plant-type domain-containing protein n=1 Tax=Arundo donax TaxID=35708 RepID=A0A0A9BM35_ARUDO